MGTQQRSMQEAEATAGGETVYDERAGVTSVERAGRTACTGERMPMLGGRLTPHIRGGWARYTLG